jgi:hypothetical protein
VHTLYGQQMGGRKSYNPKNKGKKSYQLEAGREFMKDFRGTFKALAK